MKVFLKKPRSNVYAEGVFDETNKCILVLKGAKLSADIKAYATMDTSWISKVRLENSENNILLNDLSFSSPSSAANFITGRSTNGLLAWKTEEGIPIKEILYSDSAL